ncbi:MAG TPA: glycosyltransferase family 39 protein [Ktedonobacteraceae bacterium]|nr:glycosyltransferase family 39 protein [Ktedonobacteraceae bacterium]
MRQLQSRIPRGVAVLSFLTLLALILLALDALCYTVALPVEIDIESGIATLHVDSQTLRLGHISLPITLQFAPRDPVVHEYQIDGTDSTNNLTLDPAYLHSISSSPYYHFQAWMRDLDGTSRWRNLEVFAGGHSIGGTNWPLNGSQVVLPNAGSLRISVELQRPETPMTLNLIAADGTILHITLDRNDRQIAITRDVQGQAANQPVTSAFFPISSLPFVAMVIDTLVRIMLWAVILLLMVLIGESVIGFIIKTKWPRSTSQVMESPPDFPTMPAAGQTSRQETKQHLTAFSLYLRKCWQSFTKAIHPVALIALTGSLIFVSWISLVQYNAEPHIYDASAYLFAAKMYALEHLSVPIPAAIDRFPGPFMVVFNGQWFGQYEPGTSLTLVPGIWLGIPWLVEPVLGTFALLGIGLIAARLYDRRVATLAILLGALSPFYSYLAASYLSHAVALFYLVWGLWALLRFAQGEAGWNLPLSAVCFGMAALTRDLVAVLFVLIVLLGVLLLHWKRLRHDWQRWIIPGLSFIAVAIIFLGLYFSFNAILTGNPQTTPRSLFFAGDHWGFGQGVGFYGQHTVAAGFVNLDELLTILQIDLFGWPFYLTLAFLALPFLTWRAKGADWLMLAGAAIMTGAYIGYFYHGIYLGPRYLFETLPFLLILTARGILALNSAGIAAGRAAVQWLHHTLPVNKVRNGPAFSLITVALVVALIACNLGYYMPRQIALHTNYTGLPAWYNVDASEIYHAPLHSAIVVTDDYTIYQFILFPLNDPLLQGNVIYAWASNPAQYEELRTAFPGRTLYQMVIEADGSVRFVNLGD